eukprot:540771-Rhodomonas_salina.1
MRRADRSRQDDSGQTGSVNVLGITTSKVSTVAAERLSDPAGPGDTRTAIICVAVSVNGVTI